jgi:nitrite reductase/ring-hydroxylating ferredoxin subunit
MILIRKFDPLRLPAQCSFAEPDWKALTPHWHPIAFAHEVKDRPLAVQLLNEKLVLWRTADGQAHVARELCLHCGMPLGPGSYEGMTWFANTTASVLRQWRAGEFCFPAVILVVPRMDL